MATKRDYYEILSVERTANGDLIKRAYRKLAMKHHPDRNQGDKQAEQKFKEAAEAYEVLSDPDKRQRYDQFGHEGLRGTSGHDFSRMDPNDVFSMFGFGDVLEQMFGGGGRRGGGSRARRGYSLETQIEITLEEVAAGTSRDVSFTRQDACETCDGSGGKPGTTPVACTTCGGAGQVQQAGLGGIFVVRQTCPACGGAGKTFREHCPDCHGSRHMAKKRTIHVKVPPGIHDGQAVRIPGEGEPGTHGGPRGDLHVVVSVAEHKLFHRDGDHLILEMPISFTQATLGATVTVTSLSGKLKMTIPKGTQHGDHQRFKGRGLPNLRSGQTGDLIVLQTIEIPKQLTDRQEELLREFAETENHDVMPRSRSFWGKIKDYLG
jgi:molecular chaperone DnaJ